MAFLELQNISKSYRIGTVENSILNDINLSIEEGEFVAIVGFSGSGKTTLISTIAGLIFPDDRECDVALHREPRHEGVALENYTAVRARLGYGSAFK